MVPWLWVPEIQRLDARNLNLAASGAAFTASMVAKSVAVSTPLRMGLSMVVMVVMVPFVGWSYGAFDGGNGGPALTRSAARPEAAPAGGRAARPEPRLLRRAGRQAAAAAPRTPPRAGTARGARSPRTSPPELAAAPGRRRPWRPAR